MDERTELLFDWPLRHGRSMQAPYAMGHSLLRGEGLKPPDCGTVRLPVDLSLLYLGA